MFCHNCGSQLPEDARFCFNCGAVQLPEEPAVEMPAAAEPEPVELNIPDYEPELPNVQAAEPEEPEGPSEQDGAFTVRLPGEQSSFTWEHVTISGEFTGGKGTITIHFE